MGGCLLLGRGQYEQYETSTKPVRKSSEGRAKKQIVPYGTYSYEDLFLNVHVLSPRGDGVLGVMFARARLPARAYGMLSVELEAIVCDAAFLMLTASFVLKDI